MSTVVSEKRWQSHALTYDTDAPKGVPCYRHLHAEIVRRVRLPSERPTTVVDLGAGGGRLLEAILSRFSHSRAIWVDSSQVMRAMAGRRLARFNGRVTYVEAAMEGSAWEGAVPEGCDAVVSASAIHHLEDRQKQVLFRRMHAALRPGGVVAIADEVLGGDWTAQREHFLEWDRHVRALGEARRVSPGWMDLWENFCERILPDPEHNPTERWQLPALQVEWLRAAGFTNAQVWWEHAMWAVFGGSRE